MVVLNIAVPAGNYVVEVRLKSREDSKPGLKELTLGDITWEAKATCKIWFLLPAYLAFSTDFVN